MSNVSFDASYDLVVVGGGGAGKAAALTAVRGGLSVAILEKLPEAMGSSQFAEGTCAFESSESKAREGGIWHMPTKAEGYREYMRYSHYRASAPVVSMFVENSADTIEWFKELGVEYENVVKYIPDMEEELASMHLPKGMGARCQELLLKAVQDEGVDIFVNTAAEHLIMENGAVIGVVAKDRTDGSSLNVGAKAVIIATGGFGENPELVKKYNFLGGDTTMWSAPPGVENTGDGFALAEEAGGDINGAGIFQLFVGGYHKMIDSQSGAAGMQPWLWVNKSAKRFTSEEVSTKGAFAGPTVAAQPGSVGYGILDSDAIKYLQEKGSLCGFGVFLPQGMPLTNMMDELEADMEAGIAWKADSIEELATKMGIDAEQLVKTVEKYNAACDAGVDTEFHKDPMFLRPMRNGPFYAMTIAPSYPTTCGGIRVNEHLQVLDKVNYEPIPGLYAVGNDASGLYGDSYTMTIPGSTNGFAHTSGRMAAKHVLSVLK